MSDSGRGAWHLWCTRHHRVETDADVCPAGYVLGPDLPATDAEHAPQRVRGRNRAWDAADARWTGEESWTGAVQATSTSSAVCARQTPESIPARRTGWP